MSSEAASCSSQLRAAVPLKRARVNEEVRTNETIKDLNETKDELERVKKKPCSELKKTVDRKKQRNRIPIKREKMTIKPRQVECPV